MSAIFGVWNINGSPVHNSQLDAMASTLAHRGPDGVAFWRGGNIGLGHRLLSTCPQSLQDEMPRFNARGSLVLTADARIDNRDELVASLDFTGRQRDSITDAELILAAYERWGTSCPQKLLGDFSFAIWDIRTQTLFCARDPFGVKPFYYHWSPGRFLAFASEIGALLKVPEVPRRLNEVLIGDLFEPSLEGYDKSATFYRDILKLQPGHVAVVRRDSLSQEPFWRLDSSFELKLRSDHEYAEAFSGIFTEAIKRRLRTPSAGVMLSGGLDSSAIACVGSRIAGTGLHAFSAVSENSARCPETPYINAVLKANRIIPHIVSGRQALDFACDFHQVIATAEEPYDATRQFIPRLMYRTAHDIGVRAVLDGVDGDLTTSQSPDYLAYFLLSGRWRSMVSEAFGLCRRTKHPLWIVLRRHAIRPLAPKFIVNAWLALRHNSNEHIGFRMFNPEFVRRVGLAERLRDLEARWFSLARNLRENQWRDLTWGHIPFSFESYDRAASRFSIESRHPFFDAQLVQFCLSLPVDQKIRGGWTKSILRRSLGSVLPDLVRWRTDKPNLGGEFFPALLRSQKHLIGQVMSKEIRITSPYLNLGQLDEVYQHYLSRGRPDDLGVVWSAVNLATWLRQRDLAA